MPFATCIVPVAPLRAEAAHKSEMVSQLLLGESALVLEEAKDHVVRHIGDLILKFVNKKIFHIFFLKIFL